LLQPLEDHRPFPLPPPSLFFRFGLCIGSWFDDLHWLNCLYRFGENFGVIVATQLFFGAPYLFVELSVFEIGRVTRQYKFYVRFKGQNSFLIRIDHGADSSRVQLNDGTSRSIDNSIDHTG
jgi:hypothetical protein